jgi:hypothetical protein
MVGRITVLALALMLVVSAGCGGGASNAPTAVSTSASGWKVYRPSGGGYAVELPPAWQTVDAGAIADAGGFQDYVRQNPELADSLKIFQAIAHSPGVLVGIDRSAEGRDLSSRTSFNANILVRRADLQSSASDADLLNQVLTVSRHSAQNLPGNDITPQIAHFTMAGLPAASDSYHLADDRNRIAEVDNIVVKDGIAYVLSCTSTVDDYDRIKPICDHAVSNFRITG